MLLKPRGGLSLRVAPVAAIGLHPPALYSVGELKLKDLTAKDLVAAEKSVEGTARSLGLDVEG